MKNVVNTQPIITDRVSEARNAIGRVRPSIRLSVFTLSLNQLAFYHNFCICMDYDHSSTEIKSQGQK